VKIYVGLFDPLCHPAQNDALISPMTPSDVPNRSVCVRVNEIFTAIYDQWVSVGFRFSRELERHFMFCNADQRLIYTRKSMHLSCAFSNIYFFFFSFSPILFMRQTHMKIYCLIKKKKKKKKKKIHNF